jgi:hypothetical protein
VRIVTGECFHISDIHCELVECLLLTSTLTASFDSRPNAQSTLRIIIDKKHSLSADSLKARLNSFAPLNTEESLKYPTKKKLPATAVKESQLF